MSHMCTGSFMAILTNLWMLFLALKKKSNSNKVWSKTVRLGSTANDLLFLLVSRVFQMVYGLWGANYLFVWRKTHLET